MISNGECVLEIEPGSGLDVEWVDEIVIMVMVEAKAKVKAKVSDSSHWKFLGVAGIWHV